MKIEERFLSPTLPAGFYWFNKPAEVKLGHGLEIYAGEKTDFWQTTHYGFRRDDGHCLFTKMRDDFSILTQVEFRPKAQYDQCGLMIRVDEQNWIKVSTEYEDETTSRLGSVVTNLGYSDWATQDIASSHRSMWYRVSKNGSDFLIESSYDGQAWSQMRIAHLHALGHSLEHPLQIGPYACSPIGKSFWSKFSLLSISENKWGVANE